MNTVHSVHIDVGAILQHSHQGACTNLLTRATGRTVRAHIEDFMAAGQPGTVSVIDFSSVDLLDFSCADEIVATLMRRCCATAPETASYLLFSGITDNHLDAIQHVLESQHLALVVRLTGLGTLQLVGVVDDTERAVWEAAIRSDSAGAESLSAETGLDLQTVDSCLGLLHRRRLLVRDDAGYHAPLGAVA